MDLSPQDAMSIVTEMKRTIGRDVNIIENTGVILASTNKTRIGTVHEGARQLIENGLDSFTVWADDPARGVQHGINLPVVLDGRIECVIGVTGDPAEVSVFGAVIRRLMEIMLESLRQRRRLAQMDSARDAFLEALFFENSLSPAELAERGQLLGFVPESTCTAVLLRPVAETGAEALAGLSGQTLLANIRRTDLPGKGSHCAILRGELAALLCGVGRREAGTFVRRLCAEAESLCGAAMAAGIGDTAAGILSARRSFREARAAVRAACASGAGGRVCFYDQVSLEYLAESIPRALLRDLEETTFAECTAEEAHDLKALLRIYFAQDGDLRRCAEVLYLHRNTVQYRLDRIRAKTGYDFRKPRDAFLLYLASLDGGNES